MSGLVSFTPQVQSDHYEEFFAPGLEKHGYTSIYKKKTGEVILLFFFLFGLVSFQLNHRR